jgi:hypothetical protein
MKGRGAIHRAQVSEADKVPSLADTTIYLKDHLN